jgi:hypothetical protein
MKRTTDQSYPIQLYVPFSKIDAETGTVEGFSTAEMNDLQGERVPLSVAKEAFAEAAARNGPGVHEMHLPKVVGTFDSWWEDTTESGHPGVMNRVKLSRSTDGRDCLIKCQENALKGFSIGGRGLSFHYDPDGTKVYDKIFISEVSLVDTPACPDARFTLVKFFDPDDPEAPEGDIAKADGSYDDLRSALEDALCDLIDDAVYVRDWGPDWVIYTRLGPCDDCEVAPEPPTMYQASYAVDKDGAFTFADAVEVAPETVFVPVTETDAPFGKVAIPKKEGAPQTAPKGFPHGQNTDNYADPANHKWPIDSKGRTRSAMAYYNAGRGKEGYSDAEWATIGNRIALKASSYFGKPYQSTDGKVQLKQAITKENRNMDFEKTLSLAMDIAKGDMSGALGRILELLQQDSSPTDAELQAMAAIQVLTGTVASSTASTDASTPSTESTVSTPSTESTMTKAQETIAIQEAVAKAVAAMSIAGQPGAPAGVAGLDVQGIISSAVNAAAAHTDAKIATIKDDIMAAVTGAAATPIGKAVDAEPLASGPNHIGGLPTAANLADQGKVEDPISKALMDGNMTPMARLQAATLAAGGDAQAAQAHAFALATQEALAMGITSEGKHSWERVPV